MTCMEVGLLRGRVQDAEDTAVTSGKRPYDLVREHEIRMKVAGGLFRAMLSTDCPSEQERLSLVHVQNMLGAVTLCLG